MIPRSKYSNQLFGLTENTPLRIPPTVAKIYYRVDWEGDGEDGSPHLFYWLFDNLENASSQMGNEIDGDGSLQSARLQMIELMIWGEPRITDLWTYFPLPCASLIPAQGEPLNAEILANHIPIRGEPSPYTNLVGGEYGTTPQSSGNWWEYLEGGIGGVPAQEGEPSSTAPIDGSAPTFPDGSIYGDDWGAVIKYCAAHLVGIRIYTAHHNVLEIEIFQSDKWGGTLELWGDLIPIESPQMILTNMDLAEILGTLDGGSR